ncbi:hypothetical protein N9H45_09660, partial [Opitutales bacterium]|nr:hypothetical protein [Opitutales bacterium]
PPTSQSKKSDFSKSVKVLFSSEESFSQAINQAICEADSKYIFYLDDPLRVLPVTHFIETMKSAMDALRPGKDGILGVCSSMEPHAGCLVTRSADTKKQNVKVAGFFSPSFVLNLDAVQHTGGLRNFSDSMALSVLDLSLRLENEGFRSSMIETDRIICPAHSGKEYLSQSSKSDLSQFVKLWHRKPTSLKPISRNQHGHGNWKSFRESMPSQILSGKSVGIFITIFYQDQEAEFWSYLSRIPFRTSIYICAKSDLINLKHNLEEYGHSVTLLPTLEFGMDIADFIFQLKSLELIGCKHDYYLKIHSKKDTAWRKCLLSNLIPETAYEKIFNLLDKQHFLTAQKYFYPLQFTLVNKPLIEAQMKKSNVKVENLFALTQNDEESINDYYEYNYDLKNLSRHFFNTCRINHFQEFLLKHQKESKDYEKSRIRGPLIKKGNSKYMYPAGTMFWFNHEYLANLKKLSDSYEQMLKQMLPEKGAIVNNVPKYTHFLENWFGFVGCHMNEQKLKTLRSITFMMPYLQDSSASSGGFRTLLKHVNFLLKECFFVNLQMCGSNPSQGINQQIEFISSYNIVDEIQMLNIHAETEELVSDVYVATGWQTFNKARYYERNGSNVCFFCQDLEYEFSAVKDSKDKKLLKGVRAFYKEPRPTFTISHYLGRKLKNFHNARIMDNSFYVENQIYKIFGSQQKRCGVCILFSSSKSHRLPNLTIQVMKKILNDFPDVPVYVFGDISKVDRSKMPSNTTLLGTLPTRKLAELYNKCRVGICFSTTNPSRVGFEMSACGCPCIEIDCEYTKLDLCDKLFSKCAPNKNAVFDTLRKLLTDKNEYREKYSKCVEFSSKLKFQQSEEAKFYKMINETFYP